MLQLGPFHKVPAETDFISGGSERNGPYLGALRVLLPEAFEDIGAFAGDFVEAYAYVKILPVLALHFAEPSDRAGGVHLMDSSVFGDKHLEGDLRILGKRFGTHEFDADMSEIDAGLVIKFWVYGIAVEPEVLDAEVGRSDIDREFLIGPFMSSLFHHHPPPGSFSACAALFQG